MNRKLRRKLRLARLCRKYGYHQTEALLLKQIQRKRLAAESDTPPLLFNLSRQEEPDG